MLPPPAPVAAPPDAAVNAVAATATTIASPMRARTSTLQLLVLSCEQRGGRRSTLAQRRHTLSGMASVLIVDDDRALRKLLRAYLEQESMTVLEAGSGEEALEAGARAQPTLVLLDVRLPGVDGFEGLPPLAAGGSDRPPGLPPAPPGRGDPTR